MSSSSDSSYPLYPTAHELSHDQVVDEWCIARENIIII